MNNVSNYKYAILIDISTKYNVYNQGVFHEALRVIEENITNEKILIICREDIADCIKKNVNMPLDFKFINGIKAGGGKYKKYVPKNLYNIMYIFKSLFTKLEQKHIICIEKLLVPFPTWRVPKEVKYEKLYIHIPDINSLINIPKVLQKIFLRYMYRYDVNNIFSVYSDVFKEFLINYNKNIFNKYNISLIKQDYRLQKNLSKEYQGEYNYEKFSYIYYPAAYRKNKRIEILISNISGLLEEFNLRLVLTAGTINNNKYIIDIGQVDSATHNYLLSNSLFNISYSEYEATLPFICFNSVEAKNIGFCIENKIYNQYTNGSSGFSISYSIEDLRNKIIDSLNFPRRSKIMHEQQQIYENYKIKTKDIPSLAELFYEKTTMDVRSSNSNSSRVRII